MSRRCCNRGFTLVEVLAASVITAFIILVAVNGLVSAMSARSRLDEAAQTADELRYAADSIQQDLRRVYRDGTELLFEGVLEQTPSGEFPRLRFRAVRYEKARAAEPEGDLYEVEYFLMPNQDNLSLARRICPIVGIETLPAETAGGVLTKLNEAITYFGIRYFDGSAWTAQWPQELSRLPMLVEVSLVMRVQESEKKERIYARQVLVNFPHYAGQSEIQTEEIQWEDPEQLMAQ
ncbi:MAG: prepilin-type N-terminal cleavage/methylation domain-containing protein [Phycisphaerae bacterium]|nr:prepilin-type N-terminal cleavage/methylation domain-containing protein [Phycisphaerae bacterium]